MNLMADQTLSTEVSIALALAEVQSLEWGVSQQFFAVHRPLLDGGQPLVAGVDDLTEPGVQFVFVPVQEEAYHFWVRVEASPNGPRIAGVGYCPEYRVQFVVSSTDLPPDELTARIGLPPTDTRIRGSVVRAGTRAFSFHEWSFEPPSGRHGFLDQKLNHLLSLLAPHKVRISRLPPTCTFGICVASHQWAAWPEGLHLTADQVAAMQALHASFDLDLYAGGPPEPAT